MVYMRKSCYKCGNVGHFASACAEADRLCYNCKQPGHLSNECTEPKVIQPKACFNCGEVDHMIATCPQPRSTPISSNKDRKQCFNCQQTGHIARNCTNESQPRSVEFLNDVEHGHTQQHTKPIKRHHLQVVCDKCGGLNHFAKDCQASDILCYNCQKHGHIARACPLAAASIATVNAATRPVRACYSCGKPGHIARQCLVARRERDDESEEDEDESEDVTDSEEEEHDDEETDHEVSSD